MRQIMQYLSGPKEGLAFIEAVWKIAKNIRQKNN